eukprot:CAMPEP_0118637842 /NCGR_PEP_ID=MMETSP0785-20121206/3365_1 /TAXON_ID=91992 /ORGANISM="Bolidomonas pacifica, Strain CCMP 1866" /LENGTH=47 /DNA_ID= /DNA_START= /DNA_END= /DNA_ORIENTATION=
MSSIAFEVGRMVRCEIAPHPQLFNTSSSSRDSLISAALAAMTEAGMT